MLQWLKENGYIGAKVDISLVKDISAIMGVLLTFILLTVPYIRVKADEQRYHQQRDQLIKNNKSTFLSVMSNILGRERCEMDIRIFVPEKTFLEKMNLIVRKEGESLRYVIKNVEGLAEKGITDKLGFEVSPNPEGLVGQSYKKRSIIFDDDLENSNSTVYNLNDYQIGKTNDLKFCLTVPIMNPNNEIEAIVSIDSKTKIKVSKDNEKVLSNVVLNYTQELHELFPEFFK